jgi:hypothetical protein
MSGATSAALVTPGLPLGYPRHAQIRTISLNIDFIGGAEGDRTPDLVNAIHALSQLSYGPDPLAKVTDMGSAGLPKYAA